PDQEIDVHARPENPRRKSGESEHAKIGERVRTSRDREIAFVPIREGPRRLSRHASSNQVCHVPSLLNGGLRNAGMTIASLDLMPSKFREGATTCAVS